MAIMRSYLTIIFIMVLSSIYGQDTIQTNNPNKPKNLFIINIINPGFNYEYSISDKSKISVILGYGISMSYPEMTVVQPNSALFLSPFFDVHYKYIYNFKRRVQKNRNVLYNSGNFFGIKLVGRGKNYDNGLVRTDNIDFAVGPTWGIQRSIKKILLSFNLGPQFYFDTKGNYGFFPTMLEINIGYILNKKLYL